MPEIGEIKYGKDIGYKSDKNPFIWHACVDCRKERWVVLRHRKVQNLRCRSCSAIQMLGKYHGAKNPNWHKGIRYSRGYTFIYLEADNPFYPMTTKQGYIYEHRLVMARALGRCLTRDELVHHLNGIKSDNQIINLAIETRNNHEKWTIVKLLQKRIYELETELAKRML